MENKWRFNRTSGKEILERLSEAVILAAVFFVPLWFAYLFPTYNIFELNKAVLFRILVWLLFFLTSVKMVFYPPHFGVPARVFFRRYWLIPTVLMVGLSLLLLASGDPVRSFYGTIERQQGLISYFFYFLWFILLSLNLAEDKEGKKLRRLAGAAALSATVVSVYGILQVLGIDFLNWPYEPYLTRRTFSTLGQPNFLASWLLVVTPLSLYLYSTVRPALLKAAWAFAFILQLACLFLTGSRGGFLSLLLVMVAAIIFRLSTASWTRAKKWAVAGISLVAIILAVVALDWVSGGRIRELRNLNYGSSGARVNLYRAAADAWQERPWFGYGLENGENVFIRYYEPDWGIHGDVGQTADRAHNLFLDQLLSGGIFGLLLFLVFIIFFFRLGLQTWRAKRQPVLIMAILAGAAGYYFSLLVSFTIVSGEVYLWSFLALLIAVDMKRYDEPESWPKVAPVAITPPRGRVGIWLVLIFLILSVLGIRREARLVVADYYFQKIYITLATKDYFTALVLDGYLREQRVNPVYQESYDLFWSEALGEFYPTITELSARQVVREKLAAIDETLTLRSHRHWLAKARVNRLLGNFSAAQGYLDGLIEITPGWPPAYSEKGELAATQGDWEVAAVAFQAVLDRLPALDDQRLNDEHRLDVAYSRYLAFKRLGDIRFEQGDLVAAAENYESAYLSNPADFTLLKKIGDTFYLRDDLAAAIRYNEHGLARSPADYVWLKALAVLHYEIGDQEEAIRYLELALRLAPEDRELQELRELYK